MRLLNWPIDQLERPRRRERITPSPCTQGEGRGEGSSHSSPLVLVRTVATRQIIVAANDAARSFGIRATMTLGEARALCAPVRHEEHDPARDAKALEALARWMMRFSPIVATNGMNEDHGFFLDLTGCERFFNGLDTVVTRIHRALDQMRITANLAIAPTPGAAWAMTYSASLGTSGEGREGSAGSMKRRNPLPPLSLCTGRGNAIDDLPVVALRLEPEIVEALHHLGLEKIGQLLRLPRELLPARFGSILSLRLDQLLGRVSEPLVPLEQFAPIKTRMDFDGAVDSLEAVWIVFKKLIGQVVSELLRRGRGARELELEFYRAYAQTIRTTVRLSRASRDPVNLFNLLRCAFETIETEEGFLGIAINVVRSERICEEQIHLLGGEEFTGEIELAHLIERLCIRMGNEAIARPTLVESYVPENAYAWQGFSIHVTDTARVENPCYGEALRPLHLFPRPREIRVMVSPSDDREGRPVLFNHEGQVSQLLHTIGPERIAGEWWQGHHKTRDYFDVEDETGKRFWIFRVRETGKWFLHGEFE